MKQRIVFLDRDTLHATLRRPRFEHEWVDYGETRAGEVLGRLRGAHVAVTNKVALRADVLGQLPELRLVAVAATGTDIVDRDDCRAPTIAVRNVRGYARRTVPEHVFMLALALRRNLLAYREDLRAGAWQAARQFCLLTHEMRDLDETTLGVLGYGSIGRGVAELARAFGMRVIVSEHKGAARVREDRTPFAETLARSDVLTLHAPLTAETRNLVGREELALMRRSALLINCARGGLVDEAALVEALKAGTIAGAGVDVLTEEPPRAGNPLLDLRLPNLIVTPHVAWASREAMQALADQLVENIESFVNGES
ncbi:MAG TPA: D-2-hydroxyacid dehydrogenase [Pyrinomonadaceae bacterium]|nr:D-2-hydroxyacid dehydrogenase [Pyrinomonadaceae bacterium]